MHDCFIRELKDGARPIDPDPAILVSPCDAIVGACGPIAGHRAAPGQGLSLHAARTCSATPELVERYRDGRYVTLRLTSSMYHRFHAPHDCRVEQVTYISGDTWNVNPIALKRVEKLFCKNERAVIRTRLAATGAPRHAGAGGGHSGGQHPAAFPRRAAAPRAPRAERHSLRMRRFRKGEEMGWFEHGSTIIVFAPGGFTLCDNVLRVRRSHGPPGSPESRCSPVTPVSIAVNPFQHWRRKTMSRASPNGVVRTLVVAGCGSGPALGVDIEFLTSEGCASCHCRPTRDLRLALPGGREIARRIERGPARRHPRRDRRPDRLHGPRLLPEPRLPFTTCYCDAFSRVHRGALAVPEAWSYAVTARLSRARARDHGRRPRH